MTSQSLALPMIMATLLIRFLQNEVQIYAEYPRVANPFRFFLKNFSTCNLLKFYAKKICRIASESSNFAIRNVE